MIVPEEVMGLNDHMGTRGVNLDECFNSNTNIKEEHSNFKQLLAELKKDLGSIPSKINIRQPYKECKWYCVDTFILILGNLKKNPSYCDDRRHTQDKHKNRINVKKEEIINILRCAIIHEQLARKGNRLQGSSILQKSVEIVRKLKAKNDQLKDARAKLYFSVVPMCQFLSCHIDIEK
uniref:Uncharacterized protein n=1 Tax=Glossina austeni TaxID=7395 RepID=A0A1A9UQQ0_GLOAU